jgi:hypothetical protein
MMVLTWSACTDSVDYTPTAPEGSVGVFFQPSVKTSYTLGGKNDPVELTEISGEVELAVQRTDTVAPFEAQLQAEYNLNGSEVFIVPATVNFAANQRTTTIKIAYSKLKRGTDEPYTVTLSFPDATQYGVSKQIFTFNYPAFKPEKWEVISNEAVYFDNIFTMFGVSNLMISGLEVEKEATSNRYRFRSPYNNEYFDYVYGESLFENDYEFPYIELDGETYSNEVPGGYFIPAVALGFQMVNGVGPKFDPTWDTFGSYAGNQSSNFTSYPLGKYDDRTKMFTFGVTYHNIGGYGYYPIGAEFKLYLDPALMGVDYDRDYTWQDVKEATGSFDSGFYGETWMQNVQQAVEEPDLYRLPDLYAKGYPLYFKYYENTGAVSIVSDVMQQTGIVYGDHMIYVRATPKEVLYDKDKETFNFGLTYYLVNEKGQEAFIWDQTTEKFTWGHDETFLLEHGRKIDDYVGTYRVDVYSGQYDEKVLEGYVKAKVEKVDETLLTVTGLSGAGGADKLDDTTELAYDPETGLLHFTAQQTPGSYQGFAEYALPYDSKSGDAPLNASEELVGGMRDNVLTWVNPATNKGWYNSMIYLFNVYNSFQTLTGIYSVLTWIPMESSQAPQEPSFIPAFTYPGGVVKVGTPSKRIYKKTIDGKEPVPYQKEKPSVTLTGKPASAGLK